MGAHRRRRYGHPSLIDFIKLLGAEVAARGLAPIRIGDLAQPRGGPSPRMHASHQTGLDVDIYYAPPGVRLGERTPSMVDRRIGEPLRRFMPRVAALLRLAASHAQVERIYVNPVLKRRLCERVTGDRGWLGKLQPWWGHTRHFHVQLSCPEGSPECVPRTPVPPGDGCDEVAWWFEQRKRNERHARHREYRSAIGGRHSLPATCEQIINPVGRRVAHARRRHVRRVRPMSRRRRYQPPARSQVSTTSPVPSATR